MRRSSVGGVMLATTERSKATWELRRMEILRHPFRPKTVVYETVQCEARNGLATYIP
jgi:hypothetical protein